jgi:hypothetical protein
MIDVQPYKNQAHTTQSAYDSLLADYQKYGKKIPKNIILSHVKEPTIFKNCYHLVRDEWKADLIEIALRYPDNYQNQLIDLLKDETAHLAIAYVKEIASKKPIVFFGKTNIQATKKYQAAVNALDALGINNPTASKKQNTTQLITASLWKSAKNTPPASKNIQESVSYTSYKKPLHKKLAHAIKPLSPSPKNQPYSNNPLNTELTPRRVVK